MIIDDAWCRWWSDDGNVGGGDDDNDVDDDDDAAADAAGAGGADSCHNYANYFWKHCHDYSVITIVWTRLMYYHFTMLG